MNPYTVIGYFDNGCRQTFCQGLQSKSALEAVGQCIKNLGDGIVIVAVIEGLHSNQLPGATVLFPSETIADYLGRQP